MNDRYSANPDYTKIREEIRQDMEDYKLLCSVESDIKDLISVDNSQSNVQINKIKESIGSRRLFKCDNVKRYM